MAIPLSRAIKKERLRWLRNAMRMKDDALPKIILLVNPLESKKGGRSRIGLEEVLRKDFMKIEIF